MTSEYLGSGDEDIVDGDILFSSSRETDFDSCECLAPGSCLLASNEKEGEMVLG